MEENEKNNEHIDDDILKSREDILRIKKQNESSSEPSAEISPPAQPDKQDTQGNSTPPVIPSFEDITARNNNINDKKTEKITPPSLPENSEPKTLNADTTDTSETESDINNETAHAFAELLSGGPQDDEEDEEETEESPEMDQDDDHDPLAIIGNAVKMAQLENHQEDEPPKTEQLPTTPPVTTSSATPETAPETAPEAALEAALEVTSEATSEVTSEVTPEATSEATPIAKLESTPELSEPENIDLIDEDDAEDDDDDFEQLERELQELGIASEEDDDPQMLQQTPPEPESDQYHQDLLNSDKDKRPEILTDEERQNLTSDLSEVKELLDQQNIEDDATEQTVLQFDLADQILAEHRKLAAAKRQPPNRKASTPNIPSASGTVADVIDENKKSHPPARPEKPVQTDPQEKPESSNEPPRQVQPKRDSVNNCSPAVQSIIHSGEELTEFQKQIIAELVERDIELHSKESLRKKTQNLRFKK